MTEIEKKKNEDEMKRKERERERERERESLVGQCWKGGAQSLMRPHWDIYQPNSLLRNSMRNWDIQHNTLYSLYCS